MKSDLVFSKHTVATGIKPLTIQRSFLTFNYFSARFTTKTSMTFGEFGNQHLIEFKTRRGRSFRVGNCAVVLQETRNLKQHLKKTWFFVGLMTIFNSWIFEENGRLAMSLFTDFIRFWWITYSHKEAVPFSQNNVINFCSKMNYRGVCVKFLYLVNTRVFLRKQVLQFFVR